MARLPALELQQAYVAPINQDTKDYYKKFKSMMGKAIEKRDLAEKKKGMEVKDE